MDRQRKKGAERLLAVMLTFLLVLNMAPVTSFAAAVGEEVSQGDNQVTPGQGQEPGTGTGQKPGSGQEQETGLGTEQGSGAGTGPGTEQDSGAGTGLGTEQGSGTGPEAGTGQEPGSGTGTGSDQEPGTGPDQEPAQRPDRTVTVTASGSGRVRLNGSETSSLTVSDGDPISLAVEPIDKDGGKSYIKSLSIGGETKEVEKHASYTDDGYVVMEDVDIAADFVTEYTIEALPMQNGTITFHSEEVSSLTVDEGSEVPVRITPDEGYQIKSVSINGESQALSNLKEYSRNLIIDKNISISAVFERVYILTIQYDGTNGTVTSSPDCPGGRVEIGEGSQLMIEAIPKTNYRVSGVVKNGEELLLGRDHITDRTENDYSYRDTVDSMDQDYTYEISFSPNTYDVTAEAAENGAVILSSPCVDYDGMVTVTMTPRDNAYQVSEILVRSAGHPDGIVIDRENSEDYVEREDNSAICTIRNITEDITVEVTFGRLETADAPWTDLAELVAESGTLNSAYTDNASMVYVYSNDALLTMQPKAGGEHNQVNLKLAGAGYYEGWQAAHSITASCEIEELQVRTEKSGNGKNLLSDKKIRILIDKEAPSLKLTPEDANSNGYYNKDIHVELAVKDNDSGGDQTASGIASIEYWVSSGDSEKPEDMKETQHDCISVLQEDGSGVLETSKAILIDSKLNNHDFVRLTVVATDVSGNKTEQTQTFKINATAPVIEVVASGETREEAEDGYYLSRRAQIKITDRASTFSEAAVLEGLKITAVDFGGNPIEAVVKDNMLGAWTSDGDIHTADLLFIEDANYEWSISYENLAGMTSEEAAAEGDHPWKFTVDNIAPETAVITLDETIWDKVVNGLADILTFGVWKNREVTPEASAEDKISPVKDILYYKSGSDQTLTAEVLEALYQNHEFTTEKCSVAKDEAFLVYARVTDFAGNTKYIRTDGIIVDLSGSLITLTPEPPNQEGLYNGDVNVAVRVNEEVMAGQAFSGIKTVDYAVYKDGDMEHPTQSGNLYTFDKTNPVRDELKRTYGEEEDPIKVEAALNNSDKVRVVVTVEDNAGNRWTNETQTGGKPCELSIVTDVPEAEIRFPDAELPNRTEGERGYYGRERTAAITIADRAIAFDPERASEGIRFTATDAKGEVTVDSSDQEKRDGVTVSEWISEGNVHTATVTFAGDGNYELSFDYSNKAELGIENESVKYEGMTPEQFTVDKTDPSGTIGINDNVWDRLLQILTFGLYSNTRVDITATAEDATSPVTIEYYKTDNPVAMTQSQLEELTFVEYQDFSVSSKGQFVVYLKITDYAGNAVYINSDGCIVDQEASDIRITPEPPNLNHIYNKDVLVEISVEEGDPYAGIQSVEYWVLCDGKETQRQTLYSFDYTREEGEGSHGGKLVITDWAGGAEEKTEYEGQVPVKDQLKKSWEGSVLVDAEKNNSCKVSLWVRTVDNAGNEAVASRELDIDVTRPKIAVSYSNNRDNGGNGYFDAERTAVVRITERNHHFDASAATEGIRITAVDAKGNPVEAKARISGWTTAEGGVPDAAVHTATITYSADANYTFGISYTDKAGNRNQTVDTGSSVSPYRFTVDKTPPTGVITSRTAEGREDSWNRLNDRMTFGIWSRNRIEISAETDDVTSPVASVLYYKDNGTQAKTKKELEAITEWSSFKPLTVTANEQFSVYLKITDQAGNVSYISSGGMIVDDTAPREEAIAPEVTVSPEQPVNGLYNRDVNVTIQVQDPLVGETYSGLKTISYRVLNMGTETQSGVLFSFDKTSPTQEELVKSWSGSITVGSTANNSNDVVIEVYAEDNALNGSSRSESIKIDVTKPTIHVSYDNNAPDSGQYYKQARTATIVVTERNFDPSGVTLSITNTDGVIPAISDWTYGAGDGNQDNATHTAKITYGADGDYTFDIQYTDMANNQCDGETYSEGTVNETAFTIDTTVPRIAVAFDNNEAMNDKYFKEGRTATVTVTEHNFDESRVQFTQTASLDGEPIQIPTPSWTRSPNGDTHVATIAYHGDGDYTFDVTMTDMAGNESTGVDYGSAAAAGEFTVDTDLQPPVITGVVDGKPYQKEVVPVIEFSDVNYSDYQVTLIRTRLSEKNVDVTEQFIRNMNVGAKGGKGSIDTLEMIQENDGIYTLTASVEDKAGNTAETSVVFTLNRFGSVYVYGDYLTSLIRDGGAYVNEVEADLQVFEYNATPLESGSLKIEVTRDGKPLDHVDYDVNPEINDMAAESDSGWFQYEYTIGKDNFGEEGVYKISVSSRDKANNTPENTNYEDMGILFRVDKNAPELTSVAGLEEKIINATEVNVTYDVYDTIGLKSVRVYVNGNMEEHGSQDFGEDYNNYSGSFTLRESNSAQKVRIEVEDLAGNIRDTDAEDFQSVYSFHGSVTVSTNSFVRFYANKTLFWGCVGGAAAALGAASTAVILVRRRRKVST